MELDDVNQRLTIVEEATKLLDRELDDLIKKKKQKEKRANKKT
jgi:hypothetical protein